MPKTKQDKEVENKAQEAYLSFLMLCKQLFAENFRVDNINQLPEDSPYLENAKSIVEEFGLDWEKLSVEDSNEVALTLLEDYFNAINIDDKYSFSVSIVAKLKQPKEKAE